MLSLRLKNKPIIKQQGGYKPPAPQNKRKNEMTETNNRYIISKKNNRYVIWEKPIFKFFLPNTSQLQFVKSYKTLRSAKKYIKNNNDNKYRILGKTKRARNV